MATPTLKQIADAQVLLPQALTDIESLKVRVTILEGGVKPTPVPTISFANPNVSVAEGNSGTMTVTSILSVARNGLAGALTINLTYAGTATSGTDYATPPTSVTIGAGQSSVSFDLQINGDTAVEADETIIINATLQGYSATASKTITITNDDSSGSATITSPSSQTQPSGSQRVYRATASRPGTWSLGSGGNAADFAVTDAANGLYWQTATAAQAQNPTVASSKTVPLVFTPSDNSGVVTQTVTVTMAQSVAATTTSVSFVSDFSAASGTALNTLSGWTATQTPASPLKTNGAGAIAGQGALNSTQDQIAYLHDMGQSLAGFVVTYKYKYSGGSGWFGMLLAADGQNNGLYTEGLLLSGNNPATNSVGVRQAGKDANAGGFGASRRPRSDGTFDYVWTFSSDGTSVTGSQIGLKDGGTTDEGTPPATYSLSGKTISTKIGIAGSMGSDGNTTGRPALDSPFALLSMTAVKAATAIVVTNAPTFSTTQQQTYGLAWTLGKPTGYQAKATDPATGNVLVNWTTVDSQINNDGTSTATVTAPQTGNILWRFRPLNDIPVEAVAPAPTFFFYNLPATRIGVNLHYVSDAADWFRDLMWMCSIQKLDQGQYIAPMYAASDGWVRPDAQDTAPASALGMGYDGIIHTIPGTGLQYLYNGRVAPTRAGNFEIVYTPSDGNSRLVDSNGGTGNTTGPLTRQVLTVSLPGWDTGTSGAGVKFGITGTCPPEGISPKSPAHSGNISFRKVGDTSTLFTTDEHIADVKATGGAIRFMTPSGVNALNAMPQTLTSSMVWQGSPTMNATREGAQMPVWMQVRMCNECNADLWWNVHDQVDDSWRAAQASYIYANLNPSLNLYNENDNEVWGGAGKSIFRHEANGVALGYHTTAGNAGAVTVIDGFTRYRNENPLVGDGNNKAYLVIGLQSQPNNGDTITITDPAIGNRTYTFQTTLTNANGNVQIGANVAATAANFYKAVGLYSVNGNENPVGSANRVTGTPGTDYANATAENASVFTYQDGGTNGAYAYLIYRTFGQAGNAVTFTSSSGFLLTGVGRLVNGKKFLELTNGQTFTAGSYVYVADRQVYQVTASMAAGDMMTNTAKATVYATASQTAVGRDRSHMAYTAKDYAALKTAFGSRSSQVQQIVGVWYLQTAQQIVDKLKWGKGYLNGGFYAPANYLTGLNGAGARSVSYGTNYPAGTLAPGQPAWTATEKNLASSNMPAFLTAFFAFVPYAIDAEMAYLSALKAQVETLLRAQCPDYVQNSVNMAGYEGLQFDYFDNDGWPVDTGTLTQAVRADSRYTTAIRYALDSYRNKIGGPSMMFNLTSNGSLTWGMMHYTGETSSTARQAFAAFKTANGYPASAPA